MSASGVARAIEYTRLSFAEHPRGVKTSDGNHIVFDLADNKAYYGAAQIEGHALVWDVGGDGEGADMSVLAGIPTAEQWLLRCDRVDFPPGGIAYRHFHPGPGIRRLLFGELTIDAPEGSRTYRAGEAWFEGREHPVLATASATEDTAFVRVLLLPREWEGKRTIHYLDLADEERPKLQRATVFLEQPIEL